MGLKAHSAGGGQVSEIGPGEYHLEIPAGPPGGYRLAQLDDYCRLPRRNFPWTPPIQFTLDARISQDHLTGTWGFGFWNDPFLMNIGLKGTARHFPSLPQCAWFFHASNRNYLSLQDNLPANGFLAQCFRSLIPSPVAVFASLSLLPFIYIKAIGKRLRRSARKWIQDESSQVKLDPTLWHRYQLEWLPDRVRFLCDYTPLMETPASPLGPLGIVIWIDNQYAAFTPKGQIQYGTEENLSRAFMEVKNIVLDKNLPSVG